MTLRRGAPDGARVAAALRRRRTPGARRPELTSEQLSAPDVARRRGPRRRDETTAPRLGAAHDPEQACPRRRDSAALSVGHLPGARPPPAHRPQATAQAAQRLQALGALAGDGALADGHYARGAATGWLAPLDRDGHRRPLAVLRLGAGRRTRHRPAGVRRPAGGNAPSRRAGGDPLRQRQGLHRPLRAAPGRCALRPDLPRAQHPPPADRPCVTDHHRQGRALPQDAEAGVPGRQGLRVDRRGAGSDRRLGARLQPLPRAPEPRQPAPGRALRHRVSDAPRGVGAGGASP